MSIITKVLKQKCVYWAPIGYDNFGKAIFDVPEELDCRWTEEEKVIIDLHNSQIISKAQVMVSQDVKVDGVLMFGKLEDIIYDEPTDNEQAYEIRNFSKMPNFKCTEFLRIAYL